jgi:seryl-tRNA synthetase
MLAEDVEKEVERLKNRKKELSTKLGMIRNSNEKEMIKNEIKRIDEQINILEKLKTT